jgi:glycine/D-amino acid oxidase-like deaminating enzyme
VIAVSRRAGYVIGEVTGVPGLVLAAGFSGHGFGIGPGAGHLIADIVAAAGPRSGRQNSATFPQAEAWKRSGW